MSKKKQSMVEGALILTVAVGIVKIIGAVYKVAIADVIGVSGNGFYSKGYTIYNLVYSIAVSGFPVAVSKVVSGFVGEGRFKDVRRTRRASWVLFFTIGVIGTMFLMLFAGFYSTNVIMQPLAYWCVMAVAPSILFGCLMSIYRGYNQGLRNMVPTAESQVVEVIFKATTSVLFAYWIKSALFAEYRDYGTVMGAMITDASTAELTALSYSAAGAIFGVTISTAVGFMFLLIRQRIRGDGLTPEQLDASPEPYSSKHIMKLLAAVAVPLALSAGAVNLTTVIDSAMVQDRLQHVLTNNASTVFASHGGLLELAGFTPDGSAVEAIAIFLDGAYWLAMPFFTMIPTLTGSLGMSALPHVATAWAQHDIKSTKKHIESVLRMATLVAAPAGMGLAALGSQILSLIYERGGRVMDGVEIAGPMLQMLGIAAIFVAVNSPCSALLQAIGRVDVPVKLMILGGVLKIAFNYVLIGIPQFNIKAAPVGNIVCYSVVTLLSILILCRTTKIRINLFTTFIKPLIAAFACGAFALLGYNVATLVGLSAHLSTIIAIVVAGAVYLASVMILRAITRDEVYDLPGGKKIAAFLERFNALG